MSLSNEIAWERIDQLNAEKLAIVRSKRDRAFLREKLTLITALARLLERQDVLRSKICRCQEKHDPATVEECMKAADTFLRVTATGGLELADEVLSKVLDALNEGLKT
jgi:tRNA A37 threonylcarbamoyladenosine dehydratase